MLVRYRVSHLLLFAAKKETKSIGDGMDIVVVQYRPHPTPVQGMTTGSALAGGEGIGGWEIS